MTVVFTRFPVKPEYNEEYSKHLKEAAQKHNIKEQPGCLEVKLLCPQNTPMSTSNIFTIVTGWKDMKSFMDYVQSDAFKKSHADMPSREWFSGKPEVEVYETIG